MSEGVRFAELVSQMAHELRSPLTSIKGFSATLVKRWDRFDDDQRLQFIETIHADSERMARIVSEVLDLARLEADRLELNPAIVNVADKVDRILAHLAQRAGVERVTKEVGVEVTLWADGDRFERGLENLVENALKFSESGPVTISATTTDDSVSVSVTDEGIGIEPEREAGLFSGPGPRGQQAAPTATGLGLYLTRRLLEAQGGSISVTSEPGGGSTFTITLPRRAPG